MESKRSYKIHEFAELAGVTVKALHEYDRLGLLTPRRTGSGYREYNLADLERLEQILALKFLGLTLAQIKVVMKRPSLELPDALRLQRKALEEKQARLTQAIRAIRVAEESMNHGQPADAALLKKIIEVIQMKDGIEAMKKYYSEKEWEKHRRYYELGPAPEWVELYRDTNALLDEDPGSQAAQALADRWLKLSVRAYQGDPDVQTDSPSAWMDRENWPRAMKQRMEEFNLEAVSAFMKSVACSARKKYFGDKAWARFVELRERFLEDTAAVSSSWQSKVDLFRDVEAALGEDPASEECRDLARRWISQMEAQSFGDPEIRHALLKAWKDRRNWSATLRWETEAIAGMDSARFEKSADFIDQLLKAHAA